MSGGAEFAPAIPWMPLCSMLVRTGYHCFVHISSGRTKVLTIAVICRAATVAVIARWLTLDPERVMSTIVCVSTPAF
jgi:hypothetical protein